MKTVFVFSKEGKVKVLDFETALIEKPLLINDGWKHTATLNPSVFIEHLANSEAVDIIESFNDLKKESI